MVLQMHFNGVNLRNLPPKFADLRLKNKFLCHTTCREGDIVFSNVEFDVADNGFDDDDNDNDNNLFMARLIGVIFNYNNNGFPVALIACQWNQIWPDRPFPSKYVIERTVQCGGSENNVTTVIWKKVRLLRW